MSRVADIRASLTADAPQCPTQYTVAPRSIVSRIVPEKLRPRVKTPAGSRDPSLGFFEIDSDEERVTSPPGIFGQSQRLIEHDPSF
jgi:hypothetical protein